MKETCAILDSITGEAPVLEGVSAKGRLVGLFLELTVEQRYRNGGEGAIEAIYTFPLPWGAALLSLELEIGDRKLQGVVSERRAATERYEQALDDGDTPVLLERTADGLYTVTVGNLMAGESAIVRYRYGQLLSFTQGEVRLAVPTVIAPRYGNPVAEGGVDPLHVPETNLFAEYPFAIDIDVEGALAQGSVESPSHRLALRRTDRGIRASLAGKGFLDRDFILSLRGMAVPASATAQGDGDGWVVHAAFCPDWDRKDEPPARCAKILVDCSGSMAGSSIEAARRALHEILASLEASDRFSITLFGSSVRHLNEGLEQATEGAIRRAAQAVHGLGANLGGTEMLAALESVLALDKGTRSDILLITDGEVWDVEGIVGSARAAGQRIFVIGIGASPAESLLRRLAMETGGACEFVAPGEDAAVPITRMFARLGQAKATEVRLAFPSTIGWQLPAPLGIYQGETIHHFAATHGRPVGEAILSCRLADGSVVRQAVAIEIEDAPGELVRMAAFRRLDSLPLEERTAIAVAHGLVTAQTSMVLVLEREAGERAAGLPTTRRVPQMHAAGWGGVGMLDTGNYSRRAYIEGPASAFACTRESIDLDCYRGIVPSDWQYSLLASLDKGLVAALVPATRRIRTLVQLQGHGVPEEIIAALRGLVAGGLDERMVVLAVLHLVDEAFGNAPAFVGVRRSIARGRSADPVTIEAVRRVLDAALDVESPAEGIAIR